MGLPSTNVCVSDTMVIDEYGIARLAPWSVPRWVVDVRADSTADGPLLPQTRLPGKLLIDRQVSWRNESPIPHNVMIRVTRRFKHWIVSNPNAIQFRDRWTWAIDSTISEPVTSGLFNGQVGASNDTGTNTVAEPYPGVYNFWWGTSAADEWVGPVDPDSKIDVWYRCYVWTPPPWSDNANKNSPVHVADAGWSRLQLMAYPQG